MPSPYTYNDALDHAVKVVVSVWEDLKDYEAQMPIMLKIIGDIGLLRRPSRRKRATKKTSDSPPAGTEG